MAYHKDPRVDAYINKLPAWQQRVCRDVRDLVHSVDADVTETIKRSTQPYFVLQGNICALLAAKDHVNIFLYDGGIVPDPHGIITAGHDNKTARTVAVGDGEILNALALAAMLKEIIANNRAGGWRKLNRTRSDT
jgi:hypothetical protein